MTLDVSTPALLFPAISLLFLAYTNRFLHLSALIRKLHSDWLEQRADVLRAQIENLRRRISLIRTMQLLGAVSLFLCVISMLAVISEFQIIIKESQAFHQNPTCAFAHAAAHPTRSNPSGHPFPSIPAREGGRRGWNRLRPGCCIRVVEVSTTGGGWEELAVIAPGQGG